MKYQSLFSGKIHHQFVVCRICPDSGKEHNKYNRLSHLFFFCLFVCLFVCVFPYQPELRHLNHERSDFNEKLLLIKIPLLTLFP